MSQQLPVILRSWPQPSTGSGKQGEKEVKEAAKPPRSIGALQEVGFYGQPSSGMPKTFTVLAGEGAPTATEGWIKIAKVQRFQRASITVPEGYDPYVLTVPVLFDGMGLAKGNPDIEGDILTLEWMAGRAAHGEPKGPPPQVSVYSTDSTGTLTNLVPKQFQTVQGSSQQWYLGPIAFDPNPLRAGQRLAEEHGVGLGDRLRQAATITLTEIVQTEAQVQEARQAREAVKNKYVLFTTTTTIDTIKLVAKAKGIPSAWEAILAANRNVTTSAEKHLPAGKTIRIPETLFHQVAR